MSWLRPVYREEPAPALAPISWHETTDGGVPAGEQEEEEGAVWAWPIPEPDEEEDADLVAWLAGSVAVLGGVIVVLGGVWFWRRITGCPM